MFFSDYAPLRPAPTHESPSGPLSHRCQFCSAAAPELLRCETCYAARYCSHEHQLYDRPKHEKFCIHIRNLRQRLAEREAAYKEASSSNNIPPWWEGGYRRAGCTQNMWFWLVLVYLLPLGTLDALREALDWTQRVRALCRVDSMRLRHYIPAMMLRLDLDQECYDFVKSWSNSRSKVPRSLSPGASIFEDNFPARGKDERLVHLALRALLKLKILVDIRHLKIARKVCAPHKLPSELWSTIASALTRSELSNKLCEYTPKSLRDVEAKLTTQVCRLGHTMYRANPGFMYRLLSQGEVDSGLRTSVEDWEDVHYDHVDSPRPGSWLEKSRALPILYPAFWEVKGVLDLLKSAQVLAAKVLDYKEISEEKLFGYCAWHYLPLALDDASYLGPPSDRPSARYMQARKARCQRGKRWKRGEGGG